MGIRIPPPLLPDLQNKAIYKTLWQLIAREDHIAILIALMMDSRWVCEVLGYLMTRPPEQLLPFASEYCRGAALERQTVLRQLTIEGRQNTVNRGTSDAILTIQ